MTKLNDLNAWRIFVSLCRTGSFSDTAADFDIDVSTVSRSIGELEKALGQDLFSRNSRPLQLTQVGERARSHIVPLLQMHNEMISDLQQGSSQLSGKIRLSLAPGFVTRFMMPMLMEFNVMYPDISFEVGGGGAIQDILQYRSDIAVVTYKPKDARIVSFSRGRNVYVPVASPEYIKKYGMPLHPRDLVNHRVLLYSGTVRNPTKVLVKNGIEEEVVCGNIMKVANILAIRRSVLDGMGLAVDLPLIHCAEEIAAGKLIPILPGWVNPPHECFIITSTSHWRVRRHRIFMEWFRGRLKKFFSQKEDIVRPYWEPPRETVTREV